MTINLTTEITEALARRLRKLGIQSIEMRSADSDELDCLGFADSEELEEPMVQIIAVPAATVICFFSGPIPLVTVTIDGGMTSVETVVSIATAIVLEQVSA